MTNKKKLFFVITKSNWGGAQKYVFDLATNLPKDNFDITVIFGGTGEQNSKPGRLAEKLAQENIATLFSKHFVRDISIFRDIKVCQELVRLFRTEKPDIIHLNSSKAGGLGMVAGFLARVPIRIFTVHGYAFEEDRSTTSRFFIKLASLITLLCATDVICISEAELLNTRQMPFVGHKAVYIPLGIAPFRFLAREAARRKLGIKNGHLLIVGAIGELHPNKNYSWLINTCADLKKEGNPIHVVIIGDGEQREQLQALLEKKSLREEVTLLGFVPEAHQYLLAFDLFVLCSKKEGLPYVLLEAGALGLPVIASNIGGIPEIIDHRSTGLIVKTVDRETLYGAIEELSSNPLRRASLGDALKRKVHESFDIEKMVRATERIYLHSNPPLT